MRETPSKCYLIKAKSAIYNHLTEKSQRTKMPYIQATAFKNYENLKLPQGNQFYQLRQFSTSSKFFKVDEITKSKKKSTSNTKIPMTLFKN